MTKRQLLFFIIGILAMALGNLSWNHVYYQKKYEEAKEETADFTKSNRRNLEQIIKQLSNNRDFFNAQIRHYDLNNKEELRSLLSSFLTLNMSYDVFYLEKGSQFCLEAKTEKNKQLFLQELLPEIKRNDLRGNPKLLFLNTMKNHENAVAFIENVEDKLFITLIRNKYFQNFQAGKPGVSLLINGKPLEKNPKKEFLHPFFEKLKEQNEEIRFSVFKKEKKRRTDFLYSLPLTKKWFSQFANDTMKDIELHSFGNDTNFKLVGFQQFSTKSPVLSKMKKYSWILTGILLFFFTLFYSIFVRILNKQKMTLKKIHTMLETSRDGILLVDNDNFIQSVNQQFASWFGKEKEDFNGCRMQDYITFSQAQTYNLSIGKLKMEDEFDIEISISTTDDEKEKFLIIHDIRKRIYDQNKILEQASFVKQNPAPVLRTDAHGIITYFNPVSLLFFPNIENGTDFKTIISTDFEQLKQSVQYLNHQFLLVEKNNYTLQFICVYNNEYNLFYFYGTDISPLVKTQKELEHRIKLDSIVNKFSTDYIKNSDASKQITNNMIHEIQAIYQFRKIGVFYQESDVYNLMTEPKYWSGLPTVYNKKEFAKEHLFFEKKSLLIDESNLLQEQFKELENAIFIPMILQSQLVGFVIFEQNNAFEQNSNNVLITLTELFLNAQRKYEHSLLLQNQNNFMRNVFESITHPFYVIEVQSHRILHANLASANIGIFVGGNCYDINFSHALCGHSNERCLIQLIGNSRTSAKKEVAIIENNEKKVYELHGHPILDSEGNLIQIIEYVLDVTERKRMEADLKKRELQNKALLTAIPDMIFIMNKNGVYIDFLPGNSPDTFISPEQFMHKNMKDVLPEYIYKIAKENFDKAILTREAVTFRYEVREEDKRTYYECRIVPVNDDTYLTIVRDISYLVQAKEQIRNLSMAVEQSANTVVITDLDGNILYVNREFENVTGYDKEDAIGKNPRILKSDFFSEEYYKEMWDTISNGKVWHGEFFNKKKDGSNYWEEAFITPVKDEAGNIVNYLAIKEDVTEKRKVKKQLEQAKIAAENANKMKSEFLANMSHEIRTPLNSILGFTEILLSSEKSFDKVEQLDLIKQAGNHLLALVNDVLDFSKIEAGKMKIERRLFSLQSMKNQIQQLFQPKAIESNITYITEMEEKTPNWVLGDEYRLRQILLNLLSNAFKFTTNGTILLTIEYKKEQFLFSVKDSGVGIAKDKLSHIFKAFEQEDTSTTRQYGGTGLGLSITSKLVKMMNGKIKVESELDNGSLFKIELPLEIAKNPYEKKAENLSLNDIQNCISTSYGRFKGQEKVYQLIQHFLIKFPENVKKIASLIQAKDAPNLKKRIHTFKGIVGNLKLEELYQLFIEFEKELQGNINWVVLDEYESYLTRFAEILLQIEWKKESTIETVTEDQKNQLSILVVEDNEMNQRIMKTFFNYLNYIPDFAQNGKIALDKIQQQKYDIIFLDMQMPVMDGLEVIQEIRKNEKLKDNYVVALTANSSNDAKETYLQAGCDDYLSKPVSMKDIKNAIEKKYADAKEDKAKNESGKLDEIFASLEQNTINFNPDVIRSLAYQLKFNYDKKWKKYTGKLIQSADEFDEERFAFIVQKMKKERTP